MGIALHPFPFLHCCVKNYMLVLTTCFLEKDEYVLKQVLIVRVMHKDSIII